jgi:hypothetical protein
MSVCHLDILSSLSTADLLKHLGYGNHCREGVNGNPVLALDYISLLERLAQSLVRSIASPFHYARVSSSEGTGPHRGLFYRSRIYSLVAAVGARLPSEVFVVVYWSPPPRNPDSQRPSRPRDPFS